MIEYQITRLTNNNLVDRVPQISGNNIVWRANDGNDDEIFFYDGNSIIQVTDNDLFDTAPAISGNNITWYGNALDPDETDFPNGSVFFYDGNNTIDLGEVNTLTTPVISGNNVAWGNVSNFQVFLYDGSDTTSIGDSLIPVLLSDSLSGDNLVWVGINGSNLDVFLYDGTTTTPITNSESGEITPIVSGDNIAWTGNIDATGDLNLTEIFFYNGETTIQLTDNNFSDLLTSISGDKLAWIGNDGNDSEIFFYNGETTIQLTDNDIEDVDPFISGNNVVWEANDGNDNEIFLYDGETTIQLTDNDIDDSNPDISGNNIVWESDGEIFLATPAEDDNDDTDDGTIDLFRFRNTTFDTGTYVFVGEAEKNAILADDNLRNTFSLDGEQANGTVNPAFTASNTPGEDLIPFYRLKSIDVPGTFLFVSTEEYNAIFAPNSDQRDKWEQEGTNSDGEDIPEFYLLDGSADRGVEFNRFQNNQNGTFLYAGESETNVINNDPNLANLFTNQGVAFKSLT